MNLPEVKVRKDFTKIIDHLGYETGVEVGVCKGHNAAYLLDNSNLKVLYGVENWSVRGCWRSKGWAKKRMAQYGDRFVWSIGKSTVEAKKFEDESLDFVYVDANHGYKHHKRDLYAWYPKVRKGGMFAAHDYVVAKGCGVIKAADEFFEEIGRKFFLTEEDPNDVNISYWLIK